MEKARQQGQLDFLASGGQIEVGDPCALPLSMEQLIRTTPTSPHVVKTFASGLTAHVFKISAGGRAWTLKRKRDEILVKNVDGQTSFLNEVQRRRDLAELKGREGTAPLFTHIVDTQYASLKDGLILSPWIDGDQLATFNGRVFDQIFGTIVNLELNGFFEWDFCPGNIVDDGTRLTLFDFGYMYRFDPRRHFNSNALATPLFHGVERFETRNFFDFLLRNPAGLDERGLLALFELEKGHALKHYEDKLARLEAMQAVDEVLAWQRATNQRWRQALASPDRLQRLYLLEGFRSNVLDLFDDLHGQSCTPSTLKKADFILLTLREHHTLLKKEHGLFFGDEAMTKTQLVAKYKKLKAKAEGWQVPTIRTLA